MAAVRQFSDMQQHWAEACVSRLASLNQITGYPDNTFRPQAKVTRAEFSVFMLNGFPNLPSVFPDPQPTATFKDLPRQHWAYQVLQTAYRKGIYVGYPDNTIRPDKTITREEAIATLAHLVKRTREDAQFAPRPDQLDGILSNFFTDARQLSSWSRAAISIAAANFLVVDYPSGKQLRPTQAMTRAEVVASLCQAQQLDGLVPVEAVAGNQHFDWSPELKKLQRAKAESQWGWFDRQRQIAVIAALPNKKGIASLGEPAENRVTFALKAEAGQSHHEYLCGYLDENGKVAIAPQFASAADFSEGRAAVSENSETPKYGFIDPKGTRVIPAQFDEVKPFREGLAAVRIDSQWGFIDSMGAWAVPLQPHKVEPFAEGLALIHLSDADKSRDRYGFIDRTGKQVISPEFGQATSFSEGLAWAIVGERDNQLSQRGYIDRTGQWVLSFSPHHWGSPFSEGLASLATKNEVGVIDRGGKFVIPPRPRVSSDADGNADGNHNPLNTVGHFVEGVAKAQEGNQVGFINRQGAFIVPPKYDYAYPVKDGYALVHYGGFWEAIWAGNDGQGSSVYGGSLLRGGRLGYIKIPKQ